MRFHRYLVFATVGAIGIGVQLLMLSLLADGLDLHYLIATLLAVETAILHNFLWHERWTWRDRPAATRAGRLARLLKFHLANGVFSVCGNLVCMPIFVEILHLDLVAANLGAIAVTGLLNFVTGDRLVFARRGSSEDLVPPVRSGRGRPDGLRSTAGVALVAVTLAAACAEPALAQPRGETLDAWTRYVRATEARIDRERASPYWLLRDQRAASGMAPLLAALQRGAVLADKLETRGPDGGVIDVPSGLIHHWRGIVFLPGVTLDDVLAHTRSPEIAARRQGDVLEARVLAREGDSTRLFLKVARRTIITVAYSTEYLIQGRRLSPQSAVSRSVATRIAELDDAGTPRERDRPPGEDRGFLWRLNAYWRYEETDGGVVVECESMSLSRDIPFGLRPIVQPFVDREARLSMVKTLGAVRGQSSPP